MKVHFNELKLFEVKDKLSGIEYGIFKANVATILLGQRYDTFEAQASPDGPWAATKNVDQKLIDARSDYRKEMKEIASGKRKSLSKKAKKMREGNKILIDKGILRLSFTGARAGIQIFEDEVMIYTNVVYAARANWGWKDTQPARRFDLFTDEQVNELNLYLEKYLNG